MKVDTNEIFKNYDHRKTIQHIEKLRNDISSREESIKNFLKEKSNNVIDNTIKIKNVYGSVEKIKGHLEDIIYNYNYLIDSVKNTTLVNFKDSFAHTQELNESEKNIIKKVWEKKYDRYNFIFQNLCIQKNAREGEDSCDVVLYDTHDDACDLVKKEKEELINYDCFCLNNYINHIYFDINKKISEENYIYVLNKIYTDIFICLKVLSSVLKNEEIKNIYLKIFNSKKSIYSLNSYVNKHKENFCDILLKLIYSSYYNLTYNSSCKIKTIPKSVIVLLLFHNKQNCEVVEIIKNDLFKEILNTRINLLHNIIEKKKNIENFLDFNKLKTLFQKVTYLVLHTKYIFLLLIDLSNKELRQKVIEGKYDNFAETYNFLGDDKISQNCINDMNEGHYANRAEDTEKNFFLEIMQEEVFILQNTFYEKLKKNKQYFNYAINSMDVIEKIMNERIIENFSLLHKTYLECVHYIYEYMIYLLHVYYCKNGYNTTCNDLFTEYVSINKLYNKIKNKILIKEKYFHKFIKDIDFYLNNHYLQAIHDEFFEIFFFLYFNKFVCAIPFFDNNSIDKWKLMMMRFFQVFFRNISLSYERTYEIQNYVFYSFLLNSFYYYYEFFTIDLNSIYTEFSNVECYYSKDTKGKKKIQKHISEHFQKNNNASKEMYFHRDFKIILKEKIHPLIFSAYKLIMFIENKEIKNTADPDFLLAGQSTDEISNFSKMFHSFMNILKRQNEENVNTHGEANNCEQFENTNRSASKKDKNNCNLKKFTNLLKFLKNTVQDDAAHMGHITNDKCSNGTTECNNNEDCEKVNNGHDKEKDIYFKENEKSNSSMNLLNCIEKIHTKENVREDYKELFFYLNIFSHYDKCSWIRFLKSQRGVGKIVSEWVPKNDTNVEPMFSLNDIKSIFLNIVYKIVNTSLKCFCLEYLDSLEKYLHYFLNMLINTDVKNILCERMNCHLVNIFTFSNIFILYIEKLMSTELYRSIIIFLVKIVLQKKIYKIYSQFISKLREIYLIQYEQKNDKNRTLLNKKITEMYNIMLLDLLFCEYVLDNNNVIHKSIYENLILRYRNNENYYIESCLYFINIYKEKYNVYSDKNLNERNTKKHSFFKKLYEEDKEKKKKKNPSSYLFRNLIDNILTELNKLDNLNGIIFQKHIRHLAENMIRESYLLYYLFVQGPIINKVLVNQQQEEKQSSLKIFNFNQVHSIHDDFIEDKLFKFFFLKV
ncbi:hypothetical protein, conserved [Plasmodium gonderi]|uniref:Uncharacterized protein n=1 Tax=Plasmodium gonderi TaxID=77519 RepID=A0A1Y1JR05_PLAGO|nr:hypothetical protein, conserved [Plasmodium gonderi]GAW82464.1 hypothetical protein, conserved [Plasmodium gonderi]